jgi:hypothetical protein
MRTITLEEHFVTESFLRATGVYGNAAPAWLDALQPKLLDLGAGRIAAMDDADIDLQVLSLPETSALYRKRSEREESGSSFRKLSYWNRIAPNTTNCRPSHEGALRGFCLMKSPYYRLLNGRLQR